MLICDVKRHSRWLSHKVWSLSTMNVKQFSSYHLKPPVPAVGNGFAAIMHDQVFYSPVWRVYNIEQTRIVLIVFQCNKDIHARFRVQLLTIFQSLPTCIRSITNIQCTKINEPPLTVLVQNSIYIYIYIFVNSECNSGLPMTFRSGTQFLNNHTPKNQG